MIIKKIQIQNFQAIKEFSGEFDGNVYLVTGENELGKSSLLKAIMVLLTGNRDEVLRNGTDKGFAKIIVGDDGTEYEVELRMTKANPRGTLTIKSKDTGMRSDRISALQSIFGYQDFDANEFVSWSETAEGRRKQVQIVKSLLPEAVQKRISEIDAEVLRIKEQRKNDNAAVRTYDAIYARAGEELEDGDVERYADEMDLQDIMEQQAKAVQLQEKKKSVEQKLEERERTISEAPGKLEELRKKREEFISYKDRAIEKARQEYENAVKQYEQDLKKELEKLSEQEKAINDSVRDAEARRDNCKAWLQKYEASKPEDMSAKIDEIQHHNMMHKKVVDYLEARKNREEAIGKVSDHEKKLLLLSKERESAINNSKLPINGLSFTDDGLILDGIPFVAGKVSDSQIMEVAAKLIIASNPTVKVFRIARGESLGKRKLEALIDLAKKNGYQGFIEQVVREQDELKVEQYTEK